MVDIAVAYPREGAIELQSRFLFSDPENESCQLFLQRLSLVEQVKEVAVTPAPQGAGISDCPDCFSRGETLAAIGRCLSNGNNKKSGHPVNGTSVAVNGKHPVRWRPNAKGELRLFRTGSVISSWEIKHEIPGRMRVRNEALHRKAEVCQAIERELMSVLGIESYKASPITSTVLVIYNKQQLRRDQIVELLQLALSRIELDGTKDRPDMALALCSASMPLAATAQFLAPALFPVAAGLFLYTSIHTFKEAYNVLFHERRLGVDVLDAIVVVACLGTGQ